MVNPALLWFLPLALLPVLLHLVMLRRLRTVDLSTFRFLVESYVQQRRRARLVEFLVMLLRFGFVALVVFTLARPVMKGLGFLGSGGGRDVGIVIDASPSMALRSGGTTSLERARSAARTLVELLGPEDHVKIVRAASRPQVLADGFAGRPEWIVRHLEELSTDPAGADLPGALKEVFASGPHGSRVIYMLSDGLRRTWSGFAGHEVLKHLDAQTNVVVMDVGPSEPIVNTAVVGDAPQTKRALKGLPVLLNATVLNSSPNRPVDTVLSVLLDEEQVSQVNLALQPGQRTTHSLSVIPSRAGVIQGRFQLPPDAFPDDDAFLFCLNVEEKLDVLLVTGPEGATSAERPGVYLRAALTSPERAHAPLEAEARRLVSALEVTTARHDQLSDAMLNAADAVLLADVPLDAARGAMLRQYIEGGGGALVLPGPNVDPDGYAAGLFRGALTFAPPMGDVKDESRFMPVVGLNLAHPVLTAFMDEEVDYFSTVKVYRYFPIELARAEAPTVPAPGWAVGAGRAAPRPSVLMRLADRTPILVEAPLGEGKLLVAGFASTPNWSDLPLKPEFVPLLLRTVAHLQKPAQATAPAAVAPQQPAPISLTDRWSGAQVQVTDPVGKPHKIKLARSGRRLVGAMRQTDRKGYYTFEVLPRSEGAPERIELGFAVNLADERPDFTMVTETEVRGLLGGAATLAYVRSSADSPVLARQLTHKQELWRTLIWVTFLVIAVEFVIATLRPPLADAVPGASRAIRRPGRGMSATMPATRADAPIET